MITTAGVPFPDGVYNGVGAADPDHAIGLGGEDDEDLLASMISESIAEP